MAKFPAIKLIHKDAYTWRSTAWFPGYPRFCCIASIAIKRTFRVALRLKKKKKINPRNYLSRCLKDLSQEELD